MHTNVRTLAFLSLVTSGCFQLTLPQPLPSQPPAPVVAGAEMEFTVSHHDEWVDRQKESKTCISGSSNCAVTTYTVPVLETVRTAAYTYGGSLISEPDADALLFEMERPEAEVTFQTLRNQCEGSIKRTRNYKYGTYGMGALSIAAFVASSVTEQPAYTYVGYGGLAATSLVAAMGKRIAGPSCDEAGMLRDRIVTKRIDANDAERRL